MIGIITEVNDDNSRQPLSAVEVQKLCSPTVSILKKSKEIDN